MVPHNASGAFVAAQFRKIVRLFQTHEAYSSSTARTTEELGVRHNLIFRRLVRKGVIIESGSGKYYLYKDRLEQYTQMRRKIALFILLAIALALLIANFSGAFSN
jgi:predicted transcriptional regulator